MHDTLQHFSKEPTGIWAEALNSDAMIYGGSGQGNLGRVDTVPVACHGRPNSLTMTLPPLAVLAFTQSADVGRR